MTLGGPQTKRMEHQLSGLKHIMQQSVNELIGYLTTPPIMAYPDYEKRHLLSAQTPVRIGLSAVF